MTSPSSALNHNNNASTTSLPLVPLEQEAPYLTHLTRNLGRFTLTAPPNLGRRRHTTTAAEENSPSRRRGEGRGGGGGGGEEEERRARRGENDCMMNPITPAPSSSTIRPALMQSRSSNSSSEMMLPKKQRKGKKKAKKLELSWAEERSQRQREIMTAVANAGRATSSGSRYDARGIEAVGRAGGDTGLGLMRNGRGGQDEQTAEERQRMASVESGGSFERSYARIDVWQGLNVGDGDGPPAFSGSSATNGSRPTIEEVGRTHSEPTFVQPSSPPPAYLLPPLPPSSINQLVLSSSHLTSSSPATSNQDEEEGQGPEEDDDDFIYNENDPLVLAWESDRVAGLSLDVRIANDLARRSDLALDPVAPSTRSAAPSTAASLLSTSNDSTVVLADIPQPLVDVLDGSEAIRRSTESQRVEIENAERAEDSPRVARALSIYAGRRFAAAAERRREEEARRAREETEERRCGLTSQVLAPSGFPSEVVTETVDRMDSTEVEAEEESKSEEAQVSEVVTEETKRIAVEAAQKRIEAAKLEQPLNMLESPTTKSPRRRPPTPPPPRPIRHRDRTPLVDPLIPASPFLPSTPPPTRALPLPTPPFSVDRIDAFTALQRRTETAQPRRSETMIQALNDNEPSPSADTPSRPSPPHSVSSTLAVDRSMVVGSSALMTRTISATSSISTSSSPAPDDRFLTVPQEFNYTDLDVLVARLDDNDEGRNYDELLLLGEVLGSVPTSQPAGATSEELDALVIAKVELDRKRIDKAGKVKLKLSVVGVRCSDCSICLTRFKVDDLAGVLPHCLHIFHSHCIQRWLASSRYCPVCREVAFVRKEEGEPKVESW